MNNRYDDDDDDLLKDGQRMRVPMMMRDATPATGVGSHGPKGQQPGDLCTIDGWPGKLRNVKGQLVCVADRTADSAQFTDGSNIVDPAAGLKPGWRMPVVQDRRAVRDAYQQYENALCNRYKCGDVETLCPQCAGEGYIGDKVCDRCGGEGVVDEDDFEDKREGKSLFGSSNGTGRGDDHRTLDQQNAWRTAGERIVRRFGSGNGNGKSDPASDSKTLDAYQDYDSGLSEAWRGQK